MKGKLFGIILAAILMLSACKTAHVAEAPKSSIKDVINSSDVTLVDVRVPEQYAEGTAKNAVNIPLAEIQNNTESLKGKKVVVFCNKGIQADQAMEILKKNGIDVYDGTSWKNVKAIQDQKSEK
ncbi:MULTISPECIES: rhodanese-like domain-containing protein [Chryseobacterium]|uniref:Rhodanese-related sulfurtransferase n=1 Tax=Chryseobacterium geocarposphaerae TaxID=1416776 RepID=A0ABU1LI23_9FLAO|nr:MULTISPECIES: rhodanese-like domain-containing protein [Chryseobacterium]MDR6406353.1 rhodanese-related sulfurtransferase [Chryseobacterium geocarposphaerae]MDR6699208.1 rhodanese-related sulfurtransferase [Chryseobacterium ginsenosidimutans]